MASVSTDKSGNRRIIYGKQRRAIRLGKVSMSAARRFADRLQQMIDEATNTPGASTETKAWLEALPAKTKLKLAAHGLIRIAAETTVGKHLDAWDAKQKTKPGTQTFYGHTMRNIRDCFGEDSPMNVVGAEGAADRFIEHLTAEGLANATISRRVIAARTILGEAFKLGDTFVRDETNPDRQAYVAADTIHRVMKGVDRELRLLLALARFAGLRCTSEPLRLAWHHIDFDNRTIQVQAPKTEHHKDKGRRLVPLVPEVRAVLLEWPAVERGGYVIQRYRDTSAANVFARVRDAIDRAELKPWPKLWANLRASCETDWNDRHPMHVVARWMGHSPTVAMRNYLMVRDEHFDNATGKATRFPTRHIASYGIVGERQNAAIDAKHDRLGSCEMVQMGPLGFASHNDNRPKTRLVSKSDARLIAARRLRQLARIGERAFRKAASRKAVGR